MNDVKIFMDANIYLDFYRLSEKKFEPILEKLPLISDKLIVTTQVRLEFERNRLEVYNDAYRNQKFENSKVIDLTQMRPWINDAQKAKTINKELNQLRSRVEKEVQELQVRLKRFHKANQLAILEGVDAVSTALKPIFDLAVDESDDELLKARLRKERGQPPGKRSDPLGDQISWEQVLTRGSNAGDLWVVSRDSDVMTRIGDEVYLQPTLLREAKAKYGRVMGFESLPAMFEHLQQQPAFAHIKLDATVLAQANTTIQSFTLHATGTVADLQANSIVTSSPTLGTPVLTEIVKE